jgi:hypothetical protein
MRADEHEGAVEGDKPTDRPQQGNENAQAANHALDDQGLPEDCDKIAEDVIGANLDETQG